MRTMPRDEWEDAKDSLNCILKQIQNAGLPQLALRAKQQAILLDEQQSPVETGIGLSRLAEQLGRYPELQWNLNELATTLLQFPKVAADPSKA